LHQARNPLPTNRLRVAQLGVDPWRAVGAATPGVDRADPLRQRRAAARADDALRAATWAAFLTVTSADSADWFADCGYTT
jgi:hypothetical protein